MQRSLGLILALGFLLAGATARADVWDTQADNDNGFGTDNELVHGTYQIHDLGALPGPAADEDWYRVGQKPRSSYEVIVDSTSGDIGFGLVVQRIGTDATTVVQTSVSITPGLDYSRSLRWENATTSVQNVETIRIVSNSCTTLCNADDVYHIRFRETTIAVPRFNNAAGQITVLIIQNAAETIASGNIYFRSPAGSVVATSPFGPLAAGAVLVLNTAGVAGAAGTSGTITISHDARFGDLAVKSVALEPATGFSFDTPGLYRPF